LKAKDSQKKPSVGLVFAENKNDADSLAVLAKAIRPGVPPIAHRRRPLVLIKDRKAAEVKKNAKVIAGIVKAESVRANVKFVIAHQDCDAVEPHEPVADKIKAAITSEGIENVIPAAPAWEIEAWWYLWPDAVAGVNSKWRRLTRRANHGLIINAKESLRRDLRNQGAADYVESDSIKIANKVFELGIVRRKTGSAPSFDSFQAEIERIVAADR